MASFLAGSTLEAPACGRRSGCLRRPRGGTAGARAALAADSSAHGSGVTSLRDLTERSEFSKPTLHTGRQHGPRDRDLRRRHRSGGRDLGRPEPTPGANLRAPLPPGAAPRARGDRGPARAEHEQHRDQHPRTGRLASGAPHARRRLAQGPLRGGDRLLAGHAGDHGATLPLESAPSAGQRRRDRARPGRERRARPQGPWSTRRRPSSPRL